MFISIKNLINRSPKTVLLALVASLLLITVVIAVSFNKKPTLADGSIIILPVVQTKPSNELDWQSYTRMEQVINQLGTSANSPVLLAEDVIALLTQTSNFIGDQQPIDLTRLFAVSNTALIVETSLTTAPNLQLNYRLISQNQIDLGVLQADSIEQIQAELISLIKQSTSNQFNQTTDRNWFTKALVQSLKAIQYNQTDVAQLKLKALLNSEPKNIVASRLLAQIELKNQQLEQASKRLEQAAEQAEPNHFNQLARVKFIEAQVKLEDNQLELALSLLSQARSFAAKSQDWLYLGYVANWSGHINQRLNRYAQARTQYQLAIEYLKKSGSAADQVSALNKLAELEFIEHNYRQAYAAASQSVVIVNQKKLTHLDQQTFALLSKIENKR
ncbi:tetratricopeptide repeat protein [Shewanella fidelis]|uniref:Tetratricopeptide repeat protein n=1 Tax=Shewanella fidelis TaxID=173509 RepID=A0AAW8NIB0_9GAMM|nr:tetratricopeptide repeat protein [Shewanella fidelis]MDR8523034.1 tetratricopeptide repeat protein [Shewanella fidelis]MDW4811640.1 tetratricopeptide repeat protein [Shewanella fidelis]MDW4815761.1 tetratricopeptide repeat protein [Shewanella fidelis]MDW4819851.1 tetratricopeptide repeat protein [Shewanella fidelis]MDW4824175.1 tetratricopeptide repeat protein [Shewanella fidelis]